MTKRSPPLSLQQIEIIDVQRMARLEADAYHPNEAQSPLVLEYRADVARNLCFVAFLEGKDDFIGFISATAASDDTRHITKESSKNHDVYGHVLCIHSIVIDSQYRRKGYGTAMMTLYLKKIRQTSNMKKILLQTRRHLIPFFERLGFRPLTSTSSKDAWCEMTLDV